MREANHTRYDRERIDHFLRHYNVIDEELRRRQQKNREVGFVNLIDDFEAAGGAKDDTKCLRRAAALRNVVVHDPKEGDEVLAVPSKWIVERLSEIAQRILYPTLVIPLFEKQVETVSPAHSLSHVFKQIRYRDFSQFPVYEETRFKGLLTENGLTRWLAKHVVDRLSLVDLEDVYVAELLHEEEQRNNCHFVDRNVAIELARKMFREQEMLEAILITENGQRTEPPLGIITRWDMLH
jgi:predicted transcriptional regulator